MPDLRSNFTALDKCLSILGKAHIADHIGHLTITLSQDDWVTISKNRGMLTNLSMSVDKPINFVTDYGKRSLWFYRGVCHNPSGPALTTHEDGYSYVRYTDEHGYDHRVDGPTTVQSSKDGYEEIWKINPGIDHRVGGPSHTLIERSNLPYTWGKLVKENFSSARYLKSLKRFSPENEVELYSKRTQSWKQNGRPYRENKLYTEMLEEGVTTVSIVTPSLIPSTYTYVSKVTYLWHNEDGQASRDDGPAMVVLHNVTRLDHGAEKRLLDWSTWSGSWFCNDKPIDFLDLKKWLEKNDIELIKTPPVERNAFAREDDAFCFLTDYFGRGNDATGTPF